MKGNLTRLGDVLKINSSTYTPEMSWKFVNYLDTGNITENVVSGIQLIDMSKSDLPDSAKRMVKYNSILYSTVRPINRHYGIIKNIPDNFLVSMGFAVIDVDEDKADADFIYFLLSQNNIIEKLQTIAEQSATSYPAMNPWDIEDLMVYLPLADEQKKIAKLLGSITGKISVNRRINDNLQNQLKLLYDHWFVQFDFPDENGTPYHASGGKMVWSEDLKREIPYGWEVKTLSQILKKNDTIFDFTSEQPTIDLSVMPSDSMVLADLNTSSNFTTNLYTMKRGDILVGAIRPYLHKAGLAPCDGAVAGTVHSYRVRKEHDYNFALFSVCRGAFFDYAINMSTGTKMPVVSSDYILEYKLPYSASIVQKFNGIPFMNTVSRKVQENLKLTQLQNWLLPMMMNGQATVA